MPKMTAGHLGSLGHGSIQPFTYLPGTRVPDASAGLSLFPFHSENTRKGDSDVSQVPQGKALCSGAQQWECTHNPKKDMAFPRSKCFLWSERRLLSAPMARREDREERPSFLPLSSLIYTLIFRGNSEPVHSFSMY